MIPTINDIIGGLIDGTMTAIEAENWINQHVVLAEDQFSLRAEFAAMAMQGLITREVVRGHEAETAQLAVTCADALLEALK